MDLTQTTWEMWLRFRILSHGPIWHLGSDVNLSRVDTDKNLTLPRFLGLKYTMLQFTYRLCYWHRLVEPWETIPSYARLHGSANTAQLSMG